VNDVQLLRPHTILRIKLLWQRRRKTFFNNMTLF